MIWNIVFYLLYWLGGEKVKEDGHFTSLSLGISYRMSPSVTLRQSMSTAK